VPLAMHNVATGYRGPVWARSVSSVTAL